MLITASAALLEQLADEQRRVVSRWRAMVLLRRATFAIPPHERRWHYLPERPEDVSSVLRQMRERRALSPIKGFPTLGEVTVPYARGGFLDEREILFECHPYATLSHRSAIEFHGLTDDLSKGMTVTVSADVSGGLLPIGTKPRDWEGVARPGGIQPAKILGTSVEWFRTKPERFFGFEEYEPLGFPVRYTVMERTLIDGLQNPELTGGIGNVLRAWVIARDRIDLDVLVSQTERLGIAVLRQRVGYILDRLELGHPNLDAWQRAVKRGGSSRLVGSLPFDPVFDERWSLSLNAPVDALIDAAR